MEVLAMMFISCRVTTYTLRCIVHSTCMNWCYLSFMFAVPEDMTEPWIGWSGTLAWWHLHIPHQTPLPSRASSHFITQDEKHDDEDFFQLLRHYHRQGAVLCCGGVQEAGQKQGLVQKHAFSLLQVRAVPLNWHSNEYFRMVPWSTQYIMTVYHDASWVVVLIFSCGFSCFSFCGSLKVLWSLWRVTMSCSIR